MTIEADEQEHSIELHLPFIKKVFSDIEIVPILVGNLTESKQRYYAEQLSQIIDERTLLVVSSDFCHWGDNFDYFYLKDTLDKASVSQQIESLDKQAIDLICKMDADGFR